MAKAASADRLILRLIFLYRMTSAELSALRPVHDNDPFSSRSVTTKPIPTTSPPCCATMRPRVTWHWEQIYPLSNPAAGRWHWVTLMGTGSWTYLQEDECCRGVIPKRRLRGFIGTARASFG